MKKNNQNWKEDVIKMLNEAEDLLDAVDTHMLYVCDVCNELIDSCLGRFAARIEADLSKPITDKELETFMGQMIPYDRNFYQPVFEDRTIPTWRGGHVPLYTRVDNRYIYATCAYRGKILTHDDENNNSAYINLYDRDFFAIDIPKEKDEKDNMVIELMVMLEKIINYIK